MLHHDIAEPLAPAEVEHIQRQRDWVARWSVSAVKYLPDQIVNGWAISAFGDNRYFCWDLNCCTCGTCRHEGPARGTTPIVHTKEGVLAWLNRIPFFGRSDDLDRLFKERIRELLALEGRP